DLRSGDIYITPSAEGAWSIHQHQWILSLNSQRCSRFGRDNKINNLVDPYSPLFVRICRIFQGFEEKHRLLVTQPRHGTLAVQIKRRELYFFVNSNKLLQSPQLGCEIDPDQEAGTWYGLVNKLVCRDTQDASQRCILVPLGTITTEKMGCHVLTHVVEDNRGRFGKFKINKTLGRLDCAVEPMLLYTKAQLHAYTSFILPDPLTDRTGTEEALHWLSSAICQPWEPLTPPSVEVLAKLAELSPRRVYYPEDLKVMKTDFWGETAGTEAMHHEAFRLLVDNIMDLSLNLGRFSQNSSSSSLSSMLPQLGNQHLHTRGLFRRQLYSRLGSEHESLLLVRDQPYAARDCIKLSNIRHNHVLEVAHIINAWPDKISTVKNLAQSLCQASVIIGYVDAFDKAALTDRLKLDVRQSWGALVKACREQAGNPWALTFLLAPVCFNLSVEMPLIRTLVAFAMYEELRTIRLPSWEEYVGFQPSQVPQLNGLRKMIQPFKEPAPADDRDVLLEFASAKAMRKLQIDRVKWETRAEEDCRFLANFLLRQWPAPEPVVTHLSKGLLLDLEGVMTALRPEWRRQHRNFSFSIHLEEVQKLMARRNTDDDYVPPAFIASEETFSVRVRGGEVLLLREDLLKKAILVPALPSVSTALFKPLGQDGVKGSVPVTTNGRHQGQDTNHDAEEYNQTPMTDDSPSNSWTTVRASNRRSQTVEEKKYSNQDRIRWLQVGHLWPVISTVTLLEQLRSTAKTTAYGKGMRQGLVDFGIAVSNLQRQLRLNEFVLKGDKGRYSDEDSNPGHTNWRPADRPDWLLLEIEANLLIRPDQVDVALATISPVSGQNSVLQMNMGQGKTSCIIPMASVVLADRKSLVRVVVPKALLLQTAQLLQCRLGVLLYRQIRHIPFSRRTPTDEPAIRAYFRLHQDALKNAAVMVCQPEHHLSFMLSGLQRLLDNRVAEAGPMIRTHSWLKTRCRDILDESDYTLAVRTQLVYPSGSQITVDGHPHRWQIAEAVLHLVDRHLHGLCQSFRQSVKVVRRSGQGFPFVHFLRSDAEEALIQRLTTDVVNGVDGILPMQTLQVSDRVAIKDFLSGSVAGGKLQRSTLDRIRSMCPDRPHVKQTIYLLRGLLVNRILMMTLKKRWNVQYGLHPSRDPIAVPFHAKGVPSDQSEWGHPDVAILLTCLAFYYDGINLKQLQQSLEHVLKSDDPSTEYDKWTQSADRFPDSLKAWNSINVDDEMQLNEIWRAVRHNTVVVHYFMNNFVFPRHAKQFTVKLQSNGWDIPLFCAESINATAAQQAQALTTGFSGTNDNRTMLPLNIKQADLLALAHTNAEVLTYLLHGRSRECVRIENNYGGASESDLLLMLKQRKIRVLIDAGAVVLEMSNLELARKWLEIDASAPAALYFDQLNKPWVVTSAGFSTPLLASPFSEDLSDCLVYLDEAHTRGTDLKLPAKARGALTLGLGQTKDHTVQAAMRLRQLATTQICWLLDNTCDGLEQLQPLFYSQGVDFCRRQQAVVDYPDFLLCKDQREKYTVSIKQSEQQSLQQLYEPRPRQKSGGAAIASTDLQLVEYMRDLEARRRGFQDTGRAVHASALQEVEQEREVAFEVESVRQVKKSLSYMAYSFPGLHSEIETLARTGRLPADSHVLVPAFKSLARTATGRRFRVSDQVTEPQLFISAEFERTVKLGIDLAVDSFIRPVNWILWSSLTQTAVIIIPEEAELLLPIMQGQKSPAPVYLLTYAAPITRKMLHFGRLDFFSAPSLPEGWKAPLWLKIQLGIYAGRLYFEWDEYGPLCQFLGIQEGAMAVEEVSSSDEVSDNAIASVDGGHDVKLADNIHEVSNSEESLQKTRETGDASIAGSSDMLQHKAYARLLTSKPLTFMQEWLDIRRRGQDFVHTPMGFIAQGKAMHEDHAFFRLAEHETVDRLFAPVLRPAEAEGANHIIHDYDGVGDMGANVATDVDVDEDEFEYNTSEYGTDSEDE
ncbi:hypothetical protein ACHAQH_005717, partial [Verticillium albo-atrum]